MSNPQDQAGKPDGQEHFGDLLARLEADPDMTLTGLENDMVEGSPRLKKLIADYKAGLEALDLFQPEAESSVAPLEDCTLVDGVQLIRQRDPKHDSAKANRHSNQPPRSGEAGDPKD